MNGTDDGQNDDPTPSPEMIVARRKLRKKLLEMMHGKNDSAPTPKPLSPLYRGPLYSGASSKDGEDAKEDAKKDMCDRTRERAGL